MHYSSVESAIPHGCASFPSIIGLSMLTPKSMAKTLPHGDSMDVSPRGPESVKKRELFFSERTMEFGPLSGFPSKSLITGVISILYPCSVKT